MPEQIDSSIHIDDMPQDELDALQRFHSALRRVIAVHGLINPGVDALDALSARIHDLADDLEALPHGRPFLRFTGRMPEEDPNATIPFSPITGRYSAMSMPLELSIEGNKLVGIGTYNEAYEGPNRCVHGGIVAAIYDQVLAQANILNKTGGPTASLTVYYKKPTPLHVPLRFEAWTETIDGRKITTKGRCLVDGEVISEAEGLFIRLDPTRTYPQWSNRVQSYDEPKSRENEGE